MKSFLKSIGVALASACLFVVVGLIATGVNHNNASAQSGSDSASVYTFASVARVIPTSGTPFRMASANADGTTGTQERCYPVLDVTTGHASLGIRSVKNQSSGDVTYTVTKNGTATGVTLAVTAGAENNVSTTGTASFGVGDCVGVTATSATGSGQTTSFVGVRLHD